MNHLKEHLRIFFYRHLWLQKKKSGEIPSNAKIYTVATGYVFFGYYDVSPFSQDNNLLLACVAPPHHRPPRSKEAIRVGFFKLVEPDSFQTVDTTSTWCWQQGCRLQWFPANQNELIVYNKIVQGQYGAVVQAVHTKDIVKEYSRPIYSLDKSGTKALSLNFSRLHRLRPGYGYINFPDETAGESTPAHDGIWVLDLTTGKSELLITLDELAGTDPQPTMANAEHYVNHVLFNPDGTRFLFLHLWHKDNRRYNRLITCDRKGQNVDILEQVGLVSHCTWKSDTELLATVINDNRECQYRVYCDCSHEKSIVAEGMLRQDGHPSYSPKGSVILTDTYPDRYGDQHLLVYDAAGGVREIACFFSPAKFRGELRCDLHPRWDHTGTRACVDIPHKGQRALAVIHMKGQGCE